MIENDCDDYEAPLVFIYEYLYRLYCNVTLSWKKLNIIANRPVCVFTRGSPTDD